MTIIRPDQLFNQAERLCDEAGGHQVDLRRSASAAYYGLFHAVSIAIADHAVGATRRRSDSWNLVARSLSHTKLSTLCREIAKSSPSPKFRPFIQPPFVRTMKQFCDAVIELQAKRYQADYDHSASFKVSEIRAIIATARAAHAQFGAIPFDDRRIFILLLTFDPRPA